MTNHTHYAYTASATAVFVELPAFERCRARYLDDEAFSALQYLLMRNPVAGNLIQETGGLRKLRFADARRGKGKRGGLRVVYYWWEPGSEFWLFTLFGKDEMADLRPHERQALKAMVKAELEIKEEPMKKATTRAPRGAAKRDLFSELREGFVAFAEARQGKRTLRSHSVDFKPAPDISPKDLIQLRETRNMSRGLFARYLRTNVRTLENWEQGRVKPNAQAALLISLVKRYPDTVERLATI